MKFDFGYKRHLYQAKSIQTGTPGGHLAFEV